VRVLILDGPGPLGPALATELAAAGMEPVLAGRDPGRYEQPLDLRGDLGDLFRAAGRAAVVVDLTGSRDRRLVERATAAGAAFVEADDDCVHLSDLAGMQVRTPVLAGVRPVPVLAGLLARDVLGQHHLLRRHDLLEQADSSDPVEIGVVLGAGDPIGAADTGSIYPLFGTWFTDPATGDEVRNFGQGRSVRLPGGGRRRMVRVNFPDQQLLSAALGHPVRTWFATGDRFSTAVLDAAARIRPSASIPTSFHLPGRPDWLVFARSGQGAEEACSWASGPALLPCLVRTAAIATRRAPTLPPGLHRVQDLLTLSDLTDVEALTLNRAGSVADPLPRPVGAPGEAS